MATQIESLAATSEAILERQRLGLDRYDEVWDGEYFMAPMPNNEHQEIAFEFASIVRSILGREQKARISVGANVSDQSANWRKNYRCPDVAVVFPGGAALDRRTYWQGGPDFVAEIVSPDDHSRDKFDFYAKVGSREFQLIDRDPWKLELFTLQGAGYVPIGASELPTSQWVSSAVLAIDLRLVTGELRPEIELRNRANNETFRV